MNLDDSKGEMSLGTWYFDKRVKKRKYISLSGQVYKGSEAVRRARYDKYSETHPAQLLRKELIYTIQSTSVDVLIDINNSPEERELLRSLNLWGIPPKILQRYESHNIRNLFQWQVDCLLSDNGKVLSGERNLIYSAPTSGGKTLVAEILMLRKLAMTMKLGNPKETKEKRQTIFFIVPFIALADEKVQYFRDIFQELNLGIKTYHTTEDMIASSAAGISSIGEDVELVICTIERANILFNVLLEEKRENQLSMIVIDEIHLLSDVHRGFQLEVLLTKVRYLLSGSLSSSDNSSQNYCQIIGMSATLPNVEELANWLDAALYKTDYRPVKLEIYLAMNQRLMRVIRHENEAKHSKESTGSSESHAISVEKCVLSHIQDNSTGAEDSNDSCATIQHAIQSTNIQDNTSSVYDTLNSSHSINTNCTSLFQTATSLHRNQSGATVTYEYVRDLNGNLFPATSAFHNYGANSSHLNPYQGVSTGFPSSSTGFNLKDDPDGFKLLALETALLQDKSVMVFCNTKRRAEVCATAIAQSIGYFYQYQQQQQQQQQQRQQQQQFFMQQGTDLYNPQLFGATNPLPVQSNFGMMNPHSLSTSFGSVDSRLFQSDSDRRSQLRRDILEELAASPMGLANVHPVLRECIPFGVAFHHAGLTNEERSILEKGFKNGAILVLCTTSTLSAGVNLPAHRVIIRSLYMGDQMLSIATFRQMCGRAGRTGTGSTVGEAVLMMGNRISRKEQDHCDYLLTGELDPLKSNLHRGQGGGIERLLLEMISAGRLCKDSEVLAFMRCTLMNTQLSNEEVLQYVKEAIVFLKKEQFILYSSIFDLFPSPFGKATMISGIAPRDAPDILHILLQAKRRLILATGFHIVFLIVPYSSTAIEVDWKAYERVLSAFVEEYPQIEEIYQYLGIDYATAARFAFESPVALLCNRDLAATSGVSSSKVSDSTGASSNASNTASSAASTNATASSVAMSKDSSRSYRLYRRFYLAIVLFCLIQERPPVKVMRLLFQQVSTSSSNHTDASAMSGGGSGITPGQCQQFQKDATIFSSMLTVFADRLNWKALAMIIRDFTKNRLSYNSAMNANGESDLLPLLAIGTEMSIQRARFFYHQKNIKNAWELVNCAGEEDVKEYLKEMMPFEANNNSNTSGGGPGATGNQQRQMEDRLERSCQRLAKQIIHKAKQYIQEEIRRKEEEDS